jgi:transcription antitermination protein NusB
VAARTKARKRALDIVFEADQRSVPVEDVLAERELTAEHGVPDHTRELVGALVAHRERIDDLITTYAQGWELDRLPAVDRALLRVAVAELLYCQDVPTAVVLDEAVELAKQLSTDSSPAFVNGLLARIVPLREPVAVPSTDPAAAVPSTDPAVIASSTHPTEQRPESVKGA